jgi:hypothetical protein
MGGYRGTNARELSRRLRKICIEFNAAAAAAAAAIRESPTPDMFDAVYRPDGLLTWKRAQGSVG